MRTLVGSRWFDCKCGYGEIFEAGTSETVIALKAALHIAAEHPRSSRSGFNVGCLDCECKAIFEPVASAGLVCTCAHHAGRHDAFCCYQGCENILPHSMSPLWVRETNSIYLLCDAHDPRRTPG